MRLNGAYFLPSCPLTRAEFLREELCNGFFKHVKIYSHLSMDSGGSGFYYPDEMANEKKLHISVP